MECVSNFSESMPMLGENEQSVRTAAGKETPDMPNFISAVEGKSVKEEVSDQLSCSTRSFGEPEPEQAKSRSTSQDSKEAEETTLEDTPRKRSSLAEEMSRLKEMRAQHLKQQRRKSVTSISQEMSKLQAMRERHQDCLRKLADTSTQGKARETEVQGKLKQLNSEMLTQDSAQNILGGMLQAHTQKMDSMKQEMKEEVTTDIRSAFKAETVQEKRTHEDSMKQLLADVQKAHQSSRKAQQDSHHWELSTLNKKLEANADLNSSLEKQISMMRAELKVGEEKVKKLSGEVGEVATLRDEVDVLRHRSGRHLVEIEESKREMKALNATADDLEIQLSEYAEHFRVAGVELKVSEQEKQEQHAEIDALHSEVNALQAKTERQQLELSSTKQDLAQATARASASEEQVRNVTLKLQESEEKRRRLLVEIESLSLALDEANARVVISEQMAQQASQMLKEGLSASEAQKQRQQEVIEQCFKAKLEAGEEKWRKGQAEIDIRQKEVERAKAKANKYAEYAKNLKMRLQSERYEEAQARAADQDFYFQID